MLFSLKYLEDKSEGKLQEAYFDNLSNTFYDAGGKEIDFKKGWYLFHSYKWPTSKSSVNANFECDPIIGKTKQTAVLKIQIGFERFCFQDTSEAQKTSCSKSFDAFIDFVQVLEQHISLFDLDKMEFWVEDSLQSLKFAVEAVKYLRERYRDDFVLSVHTKGRELKKEIVDALLAKEVYLTITEIDLDEEIPKEAWTVWHYLNEVGRGSGLNPIFNLKVTYQNPSVLDSKHKLKQKLGIVDLGIECVQGFGGSDRDNSGEDAELIAVTSMIEALVSERGQWKSLEKDANRLTSFFVHRIPWTDIGLACNESKDKLLVVDLNQNVLACHGCHCTKKTIGHLQRFSEIRNPFVRHWRFRDDCVACPLLSTCRGGCPLKTNEEVRSSCPDRALYAKAVFAAVWYRLTKTHLVSISRADL